MLCMYQNVITVLWIISIKFKISSVCSWVRMYMNVCIYACAPFYYSVSESFKDFLLCYLIFKHVNVYGYFSLLLLLHLSSVLFHCSLRVTSDDLRVFITCSLHCFRTLNQCKETLYVEFNDEKKHTFRSSVRPNDDGWLETLEPLCVLVLVFDDRHVLSETEFVLCCSIKCTIVFKYFAPCYKYTVPLTETCM